VADRYVVGDLIGQGGSAEVYRALDRVLDREVAVKLFPPGVTGPERHRQERELAMLSQLHHPNLVELFDAGESGGRAFLVMRLVHGATLADRVRDAPLPVPLAAALGSELSDALAHVHARGITHRDVKPANVLLGERAMLSDFGIAHLIDATRLTSTGYMIGTASYMAPEQVRGEPVGPPADVYSLGLVVLEAVTGRREYSGNAAEAAIARLTRPPAVPTDLPTALGSLLERMTSTDPHARPTAADAGHELHAVATELHGGPLAVPAFLATHQHTRAVDAPARRTGSQVPHPEPAPVMAPRAPHPRAPHPRAALPPEHANAVAPVGAAPERGRMRARGPLLALVGALMLLAVLFAPSLFGGSAATPPPTIVAPPVGTPVAVDPSGAPASPGAVNPESAGNTAQSGGTGSGSGPSGDTGSDGYGASGSQGAPGGGSSAGSGGGSAPTAGGPSGGDAGQDAAPGARPRASKSAPTGGGGQGKKGGG